MESDNSRPLDQLIPRIMKSNKPYVFTIDNYTGKFINPEDQAAGYELGVLIDHVPILRLREIWLESTQGKFFLLRGEYNTFRFPKLIDFMKTNSEVWAPAIRLNGTNFGLQFVDGRHRFLWFLIHEYETMSIVVPRHEEHPIRKLLGL